MPMMARALSPLGGHRREDSGSGPTQPRAPAGPTYQAGTLAGNPLAMTAGVEALKELQKPGTWNALEANSARLVAGLSAAAEEAKVHIVSHRVGTMFTIFFTDQPIVNWATAKAADTKKFGASFRAMLESGVYLAPSQFEAGFMSTARGEAEIESTIAAARQAFAS
ncbi:MAG: aminotransferase class III-fold pyridoxal phosphate-dependent enzyme [Chloroflexi bacterium]|nr:aminotransferase class III-fold pyridoxal phosphate-dependent enzyme [Chloroflexota bacterium]